MAWLDAAPKPEEGSKIIPKSVREKTPADDPIFIMPKADRFITMCWHTIGISRNTGMGITSIDFGDIDSFMRVTGYELNLFQCEQLVNMSRIYCNYYSHYSSTTKQFAPWAKKLTQEERAIRSKNIADAIKAQRAG